jgi:hypothetical protein
MTFEHLKKLEPKLTRLEGLVLAKAKAAKRKAVICANALWFNGCWASLEHRLNQLIGWDRQRMQAPHADAEIEATLRSSNIYDVAFHHLYELLPDCNHEGLCLHD